MPISQYWKLPAVTPDDPLDVINPPVEQPAVTAPAVQEPAVDPTRDEMIKQYILAGRQAQKPQFDQEGQDNRNFLRGMTEASSLISGVKMGTGQYDAQDKQAQGDFERAHQNYADNLAMGKAGLEMQASDMKLRAEQDKNDPNSPISLQYQAAAERTTGKPMQGISATAIEKVLPSLTSIMNTGTRTASQELISDKKKGINDATNASRERIAELNRIMQQQRVATDRAFKTQLRDARTNESRTIMIDKRIDQTRKEEAAADSGIKTLNELTRLAKSGNVVAANGLQRKVAMEFNKGALSENDVMAFSGSQRLDANAQRVLQKMFIDGAQIMDEDVQYLDQIAQVLAEAKQDEFKNRHTDHKDTIARFLGEGQIASWYKDFAPQPGAAQPAAPAAGQPAAQQPAGQRRVWKP
jgi:hypothetical protein